MICFSTVVNEARILRSGNENYWVIWGGIAMLTFELLCTTVCFDVLCIRRCCEVSSRTAVNMASYMFIMIAFFPAKL